MDPAVKPRDDDGVDNCDDDGVGNFDDDEENNLDDDGQILEDNIMGSIIGISISSMFMFIGAIFIFIAAIGVIRLPDLFLKMHAATKAGTLGCGCVLLGAGIQLHTSHALTEALLLIFFIMLTNPISAHLIAKVAYQLSFECELNKTNK